MDYRKWLGLFSLALLTGFVHAETIRVEALALDVDETWRRGAPEQEGADEAYLLKRDGDAAPLEIVMPRQAPALRVNEATYYRNLERQWQVMYGIGVEIAWVDAGDTRWLMSRRRSRDGDATVFQFSRVFDGRAYSLLAFSPKRTREPPAAARELLARVRFDAAPARWVKVRTYRSQPRGEALEALAMSDPVASGDDVMVTGYGLSYGESVANWFVEGFRWRDDAGRPTRVDWRRAGRLEVLAPETLNEDATWTLRLSHDAGDDPLRAGLRLWTLCAPRDALSATLDRLKLGVFAPLERLAAAPAAGCEAAPVISLPEGVAAAAGDTAVATLRLPPPPGAAAAAGDLARVRLVEAYLEPGDAEPGEALLRRARLFFAYEAAP